VGIQYQQIILKSQFTSCCSRLEAEKLPGLNIFLDSRYLNTGALPLIRLILGVQYFNTDSIDLQLNHSSKVLYKSAPIPQACSITKYQLIILLVQKGQVQNYCRFASEAYVRVSKILVYKRFLHLLCSMCDWYILYWLEPGRLRCLKN